MLVYYIPLVALSTVAAARGCIVWWEGASTTQFGYGQSTTPFKKGEEILDSPTEFKSIDVDFEVKGARPPV